MIVTPLALSSVLTALGMLQPQMIEVAKLLSSLGLGVLTGMPITVQSAGPQVILWF